MIRINHYVGGVLLVAGTAIGAGMLALPVSTAIMGFWPSIILFVICWLCMLATAFFILDVNLTIKGEPNLVSMTGQTLGVWGKAVCWIFYLLLFYSLIAAYIAGSSELFVNAIHVLTGWTLPDWIGPFMLPLVFGVFIYMGTEQVDVVNRVLMLALFISYILLAGFIPTHVSGELLERVNWKPFAFGLPIVITSFGYHIIIPTLSTYMNHDRKRLKKVLIIGSCLPLIVYVFWQFLVLGVVPVDGRYGLLAALNAGQPSTTPLSHYIPSVWLSRSAQYFSFFAIITSFLGVSISMGDFLRDGFKLKDSWKGRLLALILTFTPPVFFAVTYKRGFIVALEYAGICVAVLLWLLPALMALNLTALKFYTTCKAKILMAIIIIGALFIIGIDVYKQLYISA